MDMDALKLLQYCKIRHGASIICFREEKNMNHNLDPDPNWAIIHDPDPTKFNTYRYCIWIHNTAAEVVSDGPRLSHHAGGIVGDCLVLIGGWNGRHRAREERESCVEYSLFLGQLAVHSYS